MITTHRITRVGLALSLALFSFPASAETAQTTKTLIQGDFEIGGRAVSVGGSSDKFGEYRDIRNGFMVNDLRLRLDSASKPYYMEFEARNATRDDESYAIKSGSYGSWSFGADFDRTPHNFNTGTLILSGAGTGRLGISNAVQAALQASEQTRAERGATGTGVNPVTDTTGEDAAQQRIIRDLLSITDPTTFKLERERAAVKLDFSVTPEVKTWVKAGQERRDGDRQIGAGTYERFARGASGLTHTEDQFMVNGIEFAEPIHYKTTTLNVGGGLYKKDWLVDAEYTFTDFDNGLRSVVWANPFRTTDAGARNDTDTGNNNAYDRGRFVNGQMSLAPSSQSHDVSLSGSVELPLHSRLTNSVSYGLTNQNDPLLPYTLNTGIAGINGAPANVTSEAALPVSRFNGEIRTLANSLSLTSKPTENLSASLKYRYYDYSNHSDSIRFPGYAAYGESFWRNIKNDVTGTNDAPVRNEIVSYNRQTAKFAVDYELLHSLGLELDTLWDHYRYRNNRIDSTDEVGAGAGFAYKPAEAARVRGGYHWAHRAVKNYKLGDKFNNPEATGLANYNWADRVRNRADLRADVTPVEAVSFGVAGSYQNDDYGASERFGLKQQKSLMGVIDASYEPSENTSVSLSYSREQRRGKIQSGAKDDTFNVAGSAIDDAYTANTINPFNYWNSEVTENIDTIGLEASARPIPEKLTVRMGYDYSESRMRFDNTNPNAAEASAMGYSGAKLANAAAQVWPVVVNKTHEVRVGGSYELVKDLTLGLNYLFSWYVLNDFANSGAYLSGGSPENTTKYVGTGATNYNYTAHMVGTTLAYRF